MIFREIVQFTSRLGPRMSRLDRTCDVRKYLALSPDLSAASLARARLCSSSAKKGTLEYPRGEVGSLL